MLNAVCAVDCYPRNALAGLGGVRLAFRGSTDGLPVGQLRRDIDDCLHERFVNWALAESSAAYFQDKPVLRCVLGEKLVVLQLIQPLQK